MLTRIEVDGFKNLLGFSAEFGPFTCIAGPNAVGKSNLFDAIEFLSLLAEHPLEEAAERVRQASGSFDVARRLFWTNGAQTAERITIAAEMIVPREVVDPLGQRVAPDAVCFRYEVVLRYDNGLRLVGERLIAREPEQFVRFPHESEFTSYMQFSGREPDATARTGVIFDVAAKQLPGASSKVFDPGKARKTVLSEYAIADYPNLLAVKAELDSWRRFSLDPEVLRTPAPLGSRQSLGPRGEHLPSHLRRLTDVLGDDEPWRQVYEREELSALLCARMGPVVSMKAIWVQEDSNAGLMTVRAKLSNGDEVSARDLSDGTLRYLAMTVLELTSTPALYCIEEPENGLHPRAVADLATMLEEIAIDEMWVEPPISDTAEKGFTMLPPLRQVIVNTHSSALVREVYQRAPEDLLLASGVLIPGPARVLRLHPMRKTWRCSESERGVTLPIIDYVGKDVVRRGAEASAAEDA